MGETVKVCRTEVHVLWRGEMDWTGSSWRSATGFRYDDM